MLQTTAAVHPGASGGAVVNSDGQLVALITRCCLHPEVKFFVQLSVDKIVFVKDLLLLSKLKAKEEKNE